jgi:hypothetical protein
MLATIQHVQDARGGRGRIAMLVALIALTAAPAAASASMTQQSMIMDDNRLLYRGDEVTDRTLNELKALGVDAIRVSLPWRLIAPAPDSPRRPQSLRDHADMSQYDPRAFNNHDHLFRVARRLGIDVLVNIGGPAPLWASQRRNGKVVNAKYKPSPSAFGKFVQMIGRRYDGTRNDEDQGGASLPRIAAWSIWNEPNQGGHLQPQWRRTPRGRWLPESPRLYRNLYRAAVAGLRASGHGGDIILLGETAPRGLNARGQTKSIRPVAFLASLLCIDPVTLRALRGRAARDAACDFARRGRLVASGFAHHPYSVTAPPTQTDPHPLNITMADRDRLTRLLDAAAATRRLTARLPLWYTENGWQTNPPDPTPRGIPLDRQAHYIALAERQSAADPRVVALTQFLLRDDEPRERASPGSRYYWSTYQTGLQFADGRPKPAYDAYRLPFVGPGSAKAGSTVTFWGMVRPGAPGQTVRLQFAPSGSSTFADVGDPVTIQDAYGYFTVDVKPTQSGMWRFTWSPPAPGGQPSFFDQLAGRKPPPPPVYNSVPAAVPVTR